MKINKLFIENLYSYSEETEISFDDFNVIVGPNAAGKTNIIRILKMLRGLQNRFSSSNVSIVKLNGSSPN